MQEIVCFHNPDEVNGYLSNWYISDFSVDGVMYSSMEQYMMHQKALLFGNIKTAERIMDTDRVDQIKGYGRSVTPYDDKKWSGERYQIVYKGVVEKFRQNEGLAEKLIQTGDAILAECAVKDTVWGIGISLKDERRLEPSQWRGKNLLGKVLMQVREDIDIRIN